MGQRLLEHRRCMDSPARIPGGKEGSSIPSGYEKEGGALGSFGTSPPGEAQGQQDNSPQGLADNRWTAAVVVALG